MMPEFDSSQWQSGKKCLSLPLLWHYPSVPSSTTCAQSLTDIFREIAFSFNSPLNLHRIWPHTTKPKDKCMTDPMYYLVLSSFFEDQGLLGFCVCFCFIIASLIWSFIPSCYCFLPQYKFFPVRLLSLYFVSVRILDNFAKPHFVCSTFVIF